MRKNISEGRIRIDNTKIESIIKNKIKQVIKDPIIKGQNDFDIEKNSHKNKNYCYKEDPQRISTFNQKNLNIKEISDNILISNFINISNYNTQINYYQNEQENIDNATSNQKEIDMNENKILHFMVS